MPKLNPEKVRAVKAADTTNPFEADPEGNYLYKLTKVESGKSKAGNAQWTWHFAHVDKPRKVLRHYTGLAEDQLWKLALTFEAFGSDPSVSTDTLLGKVVPIHVGVEIQEEGKGKGQKRNYIVKFADANDEIGPFVEEDEEPEDEPKPAPKKAAAKKAAAADAEPDF